MSNVDGLFRQQAQARSMRSKDRIPKASFLVGVFASLLAGCAAGRQLRIHPTFTAYCRYLLVDSDRTGKGHFTIDTHEVPGSNPGWPTIRKPRSLDRGFVF